MDGVAERTKASVATHTDAGLIPRPWVAFFFGNGHNQDMADTNGCLNQKNSAKTNTHVFSPTNKNKK